MNNLSVKAKFQIGQFLNYNKYFKLQQIFCKFEGQFDIEGQCQGHKFLKWCKTFR